MKASPLLIIAIIGASFRAAAQAKIDTVYIYQAGLETGMEIATGYRIIEKTDKLYKIDEYDISGKLKVSCTSKSRDMKEKEGHFKYYNEDGNIDREGNYANNEMDGIWKYYYESSELHFTETYKNGKDHGELISYYRSGKMKRKETRKDTVVSDAKCYAENGDEVPYYPFQVKPVFTGGNLFEYIGKELHYPEKEREKSITGIVYLTFVVEKDGSIGEVRVLRGVTGGDELSSEAIRVISGMPKWIPGMEDGEPIKVQYNIPIHFELR